MIKFLGFILIIAAMAILLSPTRCNKKGSVAEHINWGGFESCTEVTD